MDARLAPRPTPAATTTISPRRTVGRRGAAVAFVAVLLGALAGPAHAQAATSPGSAATDPIAAPDQVTVQNDRPVPVTVSMELGDLDRELGVVPPYDVRTLPLPAWAVRGRSAVELLAHPEGAVDDLTTAEFTLRAPARLALVVPPVGGFPAPPPDRMLADIPATEQGDATVTVDNPRAAAVTIYAEQGPFDMRVGEVPAHSQATLPLPKAAVRPSDGIELLVHPASGEDLASGTLAVHPGDHLGLRVPLQ